MFKNIFCKTGYANRFIKEVNGRKTNCSYPHWKIRAGVFSQKEAAALLFLVIPTIHHHQS